MALVCDLEFTREEEIEGREGYSVNTQSLVIRELVAVVQNALITVTSNIVRELRTN
jgi:hypothetical protein